MSPMTLRKNAKKLLHTGISFITIYILFHVILGVAIVNGNSMVPTFHNGDILIIRKVLIEPNVQDIIIALPTTYSDNVIKRVIAIPGDTIDINEETNTVIVNGNPIDEPYLSETQTKQGDIQLPLTVPDGYVFVMGDNRMESLDSRYNTIGLIPIKNIIGIYLFPIKST